MFRIFPPCFDLLSILTGFDVRFSVANSDCCLSPPLLLKQAPDVMFLSSTLAMFAAQIYTEYVIRNPMCEPQQQITSELFVAKMDHYVKSLNFF